MTVVFIAGVVVAWCLIGIGVLRGAEACGAALANDAVPRGIMTIGWPLTALILFLAFMMITLGRLAGAKS